MYQLAHRGLSDYYPENTMKAFLHALELPFDGIETDVQMTKDGQLILLHDATINRTSNGKGNVADYKYKQLLKFNFNNGFDMVTPIPLLEELLAVMAKTDKILNIEIKSEAKPGTEEKVIKLVHKYHMQDQVYYSSTDVNQMTRIRQLEPDAYVALIIVRNYEENLKVALDAKVNGVHARHRFLTDDQMALLKDHHTSIGAWTIKSQKTFDRMRAHDIKFVFTNHYFK